MDNALGSQFVKANLYQRVGVSAFWLNEAIVKFPSRDDFLKVYAVATSSPPDQIHILPTREGDAECYGGKGVGYNGGSARSVVIDNNVVKGCGLTSLIGRDVPFLHSTGSLSLSEALYEVYASTIAGYVLPHGVVNVLSVIDCESLDAFRPEDDGSFASTSSALLVREYAVRPASFLRSGFLSDNEADIPFFDLNRSRIACLSFVKSFSSLGACLGYLSRFLSICAQQFYWATSLGFVHGSFSASNVSLDGRWLDMATFTYASHTETVNLIGTKCRINDEIIQPLVFISEIVHNISKHHNIVLNFDPFIKHYQVSLDNCKRLFVSWFMTNISCSTKLFEAVARIIDLIRMSYAKSGSDLDRSAPDPQHVIIEICMQLRRSKRESQTTSILSGAWIRDIRVCCDHLVDTCDEMILKVICCRIFRIFRTASSYTRSNISRLCTDISQSAFGESIFALNRALSAKLLFNHDKRLFDYETLLIGDDIEIYLNMDKGCLHFDSQKLHLYNEPLNSKNIGLVKDIISDDLFISNFLDSFIDLTSFFNHAD